MSEIRRVSADPADPAYVPPEQRRGIRIWLNTVEVFGIITADAEAGFVTRYVLASPFGDEMATTTTYGTVRILRRPAAA